MSEGTGWAVVSADKLYVRSVSDTRRAAIVNWLVTEKDVCVMDYHTDADIEEMWKCRGQYFDCIEVTIQPSSAGSDYSDLAQELHQAAEGHDRGHGPLHAAAANAIDHLMTLIRLMRPGALAQRKPDCAPMAYYVEHKKFGVELSLDQPSEDSVERGWVATPLYPAHPTQGGDKGEAVAWVIPGTDTARPDGSIDAWAWETGEFSRPLYAASQPASIAYSFPEHFADAYHAAREMVPDSLANEIVSRNCSEGDGSKMDRIDGETDAEFVRRIVATYLAVSSTSLGSASK